MCLCLLSLNITLIGQFAFYGIDVNEALKELSHASTLGLRNKARL